jgi:ABC-type transport system involved in cytochrome c biogenesis permease subunit
MEQLAVVSGWLALGLLMAATVLYGYQFYLRRTNLSWWARFMAGAGTLALTASIGFQSTATEGTVLTGPHNTLVLLAWALLIVYFIIEHFIKVKTVPLSVALLIVAELLSGVTPTSITAEEALLLDSWRVGIHVALIIFAYAGFAIGGAASGLYLVLDRQLKRHKTTAMFRRMPSLTQTQALARRAIALAFPAYTAGILLGTIRAIETDLAGWWQDPRVMVSGIVFAVFGYYLIRVYRHGISARTAAWIALVGLAFVIILAVIARTLPTGFHVFAVPGIGS